MSTHNIFICCGYSLELPRKGDSNDYPNICFMEKCTKLSLNYSQTASSYSTVTLSYFP